MSGGRIAKAAIWGGIIGASMGIMITPESGRKRKKMLRTGRNLVLRSGNIVSDVVDLFR